MCDEGGNSNNSSRIYNPSICWLGESRMYCNQTSITNTSCSQGVLVILLSILYISCLIRILNILSLIIVEPLDITAMYCDLYLPKNV